MSRCNRNYQRCLHAGEMLEARLWPQPGKQGASAARRFANCASKLIMTMIVRRDVDWTLQGVEREALSRLRPPLRPLPKGAVRLLLSLRCQMSLKSVFL